MVYGSVLQAIGSTPLIKLNNIADADSADILVKYEAVNIGGSIKTRTAHAMITAAEDAGLLTAESVIVEPTSGNQGIAIALIGAVKGYQVKIVMPDSVSEERRKLVKQYGAEVILVKDNGNIGECIENCLRTAMELAAADPRVFIPQQFTNPNNPAVHRNHTAREILAAYAGPIHGFCAGIGTGGSITGVGQALRERWPDVRIWAVEPEQAAILSGGPIGTHLQMGIGDGLIPEVLDTAIYDDVCVVADQEALATAKLLAAKEGLLCGISSGSNVTAALRMAKMLGPGKTVVTLLPDTGERYFSTPLFD
ncbi:MAG: cysteine synthase family protein [Propionibacteriaceae bacterium]|jgi:cysteine synthase A|nr:cysteine synthase family protein [Propionibacteriaceae bacterium]